MSKRVLSFIILFLFLSVMSVNAATGIDYLNNQDLTKEGAANFKNLSLLTKVYGNAGNDTSELESKISSFAKEKELIEQGFSLLATGDSALAEQIVSKQNYGGFWKEDIYSTAIISYALLDNNLKLSSANSGLYYLESTQSENGSWKNSVHNTAISLLALLKGGYNGEVEEKAIEWLLLKQGSNGSWGSNINTAWATLALMEAGTNPDEVDEAVDFLKSTGNRDGGWGLYLDESSKPFVSALVVQALQEYEATSSQLTAGLAYIDGLITNQAWVNKAFNYYNLSEICYLLRNHPDSTIKEQYSSWLTSFPEQNNYDYLARKISVLAHNGEDVSQLVNKLIAGQNSDGGWGFAQGYDSNPWDTTLALRALLDANHNDLNLYTRIIHYLQGCQNSDGSFSIKEGSEGHLYLTTLVAEELTRLQKFIDYPSVLEAAKNYLATKRDGAGGYGGSLLEDARAFTLSFDLLSDAQIKDTLNLFESNKQTNGSWENDSLTTAAVMKALEKIKPDLSITHEDISFDLQEVHPNDQLVIKATVNNSGYEVASNVEVKLYQGEVENGEVIASKIVEEIPAGESKTVSFEWKAEEVGSQIFNLSIDTNNQITEMNEDNNLAAKAVNVIPYLDLTINSEDIKVTPEKPDPSDALTIKANIHNQGSLDSGSFKVVFSDGETVLGTVNSQGILGSGSSEVSYETTLPKGEHSIQVSVDPENTVEEDIEDNNIASQSVLVAQRVDLEIGYGNLSFSNVQPTEGENVTIYATVLNKRTEAVVDVPVEFYLGDPSQGGSLLGREVIDVIGGNKAVIADCSWDTTGLAGSQSIYVVVDPQNSINEYDETNNNVSREITITEMTTLKTSVINVNSSQFPKVKLGVNISDETGQGIEGLDTGNFSILENGIEQEILKLESKIDNTERKAPVDLVFIIDTSGSMYDEWNYLPEIVNNLLDNVSKEGIDLQYKIYSLQGEPLSNINLPYEVLNNGIFRGEFMNIGSYSRHTEHWGPGTAWVAENYQWREDAAKVVIPISDEDCYGGDGWWWWENKQLDRDSIRETTKLCQENQVEAYPFYGFSDTSYAVKNRMDYLAKGTGGERFYFKDANQIVDYLSRVISEKKANYFLEYETSNKIKDGTLRTVVANTSYQEATGKGEGQYRAPQEVYSDLEVTDFTSGPISHAKQSIQFSGTIENSGKVVAKNTKVGFYLGDPASGGVLLATKQIASLEANSQKELDFSWITQAGIHNLYLVVDPENEISESDETNNSIQLTKEVPGKEQPDLFITDSAVSVSTVKPYCGQNVKIKAEVRNKGAESSNALVSFYLGDPKSGGQLIATKALDSLSYLGSQEVKVSWTTGSVPQKQEIQVVVDPLDKIVESNEQNNRAVKSVEVIERLLTGQITTDKSNYQPQQEAVIDFKLENRQQRSWTGTAKVLIRDKQGNIIKELKSYQIQDLAALSGGQPGRWENNLAWNIGNLSSGSYFACLNLYQDNDRFAEYVTEFKVLSDKDIDGNLVTDKQEYAPDEEATITIDYTNSSLNTNLENLNLEVTISSPNGEAIWTEQTTIPYLTRTQEGKQPFYWAVDNRPAGDYNITAKIKAGELKLWSTSKTVTVLDKVVLDGTLDIEPRQIKSGSVVDMTYKLQNNGNVILDNFPLEVLLIDETTEEVAKVLTRNHGLDLDERITDSFAEKIKLPDGRYMAVMQAEAKGKELSIANSGLIVDSTPPVTNYQLSNSNPGRDAKEILGRTDSKLTLTADDNLTGVEKTYYSLGGEYQEYKEPIEFSAEGSYQVKYKSVDKVGNEEAENDLTVIIDETPPETTVDLAGNKWSDGWFKTAPTVKLSAEDNQDGSGVKEIYYRQGKDGSVQTYDEPFTIEKEGVTELYIYAVDNNNNYEEPEKVEIKFIKPWSAPYNLLSQELQNDGNVKVEKAFSNGEVTIKGSCQLDYVGTTQSSIDQRGNVRIETLETDVSHQNLPEPDWNALESITNLNSGKKLKKSVENVEYENDLKISGKAKVEGVLLVDGDLEIAGKTKFPNTGIFCTGKVTISGNPEINGVIYAGNGLKMNGNPEISGAVVVNGLARMSGSVVNNKEKIKEYLDYLRKTDLK